MTRSTTRSREHSAHPSSEDLLRRRGLRVTAPRRVALEVIERGHHVDADEIRHAVAEQLGSVSVQTIYDVLAALTEARLIRKVDPSGATRARYEVQRGHNHHHMMCRICRRIEDVDVPEAALTPLAPHNALGYELDETEIMFWGICPDCRTTDPATQGEQR